MAEQLEKVNRNYISTKVNPILEKMVFDLVMKKPDNVIQYMIKWLQDNQDSFEREMKQNSGKLASKNRNAYGESSEEDEPEDYVDEIPVQQLKVVAPQKMRVSVSAEAYGKYNEKKAFVAKVIPKSKDQVDRIKTRLSQAFMFSALEEKDLDIVIKAMEEKSFKAGATVIKQGDDGDNLYVTDNGALDVFKQFQKNQDPQLVKTYSPGDPFGELALLYNAPRAATVVARTDSVLFALDRETFNNIVKDAAIKKREKYENFLGNIELLDSMESHERLKIADALKPLKFKKGEYVVKEGDQGDSFFFIEEGEAVATKVIVPGKGPETVYRYKAGDYFGELALLRDTPRAANIVAQTDLSLVSLDRLSFKRLLGPLDDILKRNFARYEKFLG